MREREHIWERCVHISALVNTGSGKLSPHLRMSQQGTELIRKNNTAEEKEGKDNISLNSP